MGLGGQGVSFLAQVLCRAALFSQRQAQARSDQQWAIRGGIVSAQVLVDEQLFSPAELRNYNVLICLHPSSRSLKPAMAKDSLKLDAYELEAYRLSERAGFTQGLNMVMLGMLLAQCEICPLDAVIWQLRHLLGRDQMSVLPYNLELLEQGYKLGTQDAGHSRH